MTLTIPEKFNHSFLESNINNSDWAEYVKDHSEDILKNLDDCPFEEACWALSYSLAIWIDGKEDSPEIRHVNNTIIRISRMGVNELLKAFAAKKINPLVFFEKQGDLLTKCATAMINVGRPIAALNLLGTAEDCFLNILQCIPKEDVKTLNSYRIGYECIRAKEAEVGVRIVHYVPEDVRSLFANAANSYLIHSIVNLTEYGGYDEAEYYTQEVAPYAEQACLIYFKWTQKEIDDLNHDSIKDDYQRWCQERYLFLNIMNEIPHKSETYAKDDLQFDLDDRHRYLLEDIVQTYSHCRKLFYAFKDPFIFQEKTERDDDVESLIDCYVRLYTLFDKCAKLIQYLFPQDWSDEKVGFYETARKLACENNPYLRAIDMICSDVFPDKASKKAGVSDPRNMVNGRLMWRGFIRNSIMHNTFKIKPDMESNDFITGVAFIPAFELYHATLMTFYDIREILLNIQLATYYSKSG